MPLRSNLQIAHQQLVSLGCLLAWEMLPNISIEDGSSFTRFLFPLFDWSKRGGIETLLHHNEANSTATVSFWEDITQASVLSKNIGMCVTP